MPKLPKTCSRCHLCALVTTQLRACTKENENGKPRNWLFSPELAKAQALCDDRTNTEFPKIE
jgi:hypothetical protein